MITREEGQRIAKLSRLTFEEEKIEYFTNQLTNIVNMIDILNEVDCANVIPLTSVCGMNQRMRVDEVVGSDLSDELFSNLSGEEAKLAKEVKCFVVPKMVE